MVRPGRQTPFSSSAAASGRVTYEDISAYSVQTSSPSAFAPKFSDITATTILQNIQDRLNGKEEMYTALGDRALIALNPLRVLNTNSDSNSKEYASIAKSTSSTDKSKLSPHVFRIASSAYLHMLRSKEDQGIILCGETGSGKSESHNRIARHLCDLSKSSKKKTRIQSAVLKIDSVLSAYGGCITSQNKNATCFAKYTEYQFDTFGKMVGAKTIETLLDKQRIVGGSLDGRNFNVLYYLVCGASIEEKEQWFLSDQAHFHYLNQSKVRGETNEEMSQKFQNLRDDMINVGIGRRQQAQVYQILAAILHLGNITFVADKTGNKDSCNVKNIQQLSLVAKLLGLDEQTLEDTLTFKTVIIKKEISTVLLNVQGASEQRDALARTLYSGVFSWVIEQINDTLCKGDAEWKNFIGVLDTPGFSASPNSCSNFQQLLSNFTQERLNSFTTDQLFSIPRALLVEDDISVPSNLKIEKSPVVNLFNHPSTGLLSVISVQSIRASTTASLTGSSEKMSEKIHSVVSSQDKNTQDYFIISSKTTGGLKQGSLPRYGSLSRGVSTSTPSFGIKHFLGTVDYDTRDFAASAADNIQPDFVTLIRGSPEQRGTTNGFVRSLFSDRLIATTMVGHMRDMMIASAKAKNIRYPSMKRNKKKGESKMEINKPEEEEDEITVVAEEFSACQNINDILTTLAETRTWFIFHIRPTADSTGRFNAETVKRQIEGFNLATLACSPTLLYTSSIPHGEFKNTFATLHAQMRLDSGSAYSQSSTIIRTKKWTTPRQASNGKHRLYLSEMAWSQLDDETRALEDVVNEEEIHELETRENNRLSAHSSGSELVGSNATESDGGLEKEYDDNESHYDSEFEIPSNLPKDRVDEKSGDIEMGNMKVNEKDSNEKEKEAKPLKSKKEKKAKKIRPPLSRQRCRWLTLTWLLTFCIPPFVTSCCLRHHEQRMAWREKVALCVLVFLMCAFILFFIVGVGLIICPKQKVLSSGELSAYNKAADSYIFMYGNYYKIPEILTSHLSKYGGTKGLWEAEILGQDASQMIPKDSQWSYYCKKFDKPASFQLFPVQSDCIKLNQCYSHTGDSALTISDILDQIKADIIGRVVWDSTSISNFLKQNSCNKIIKAYDRIYDVSSFYCGQYTGNFFGTQVKNIFDRALTATSDSTIDFETLKQQNPQLWSNTFYCMEELFRVGDVDHRNDLKCVIPNYILLVSSCVLVAVIGFKFLAALQFTQRRQPEEHDKFVICQVPCYTEGETSLRRALDSLAVLEYDDRHKLLFVICDGMIIGSGNDRPTPRIVLDILGVDPSVDPEALQFQSLGDGSKQLNYAKIYSGLYEVAGRFVPFIVVVKVGKPSERSKPGNRGKRDSQMILMRFLSRVHFNQPMNPMELDIYHQMKNVIGVDPAFYEYVFMVDADTEVYPDSLNRLVSAMTRDSKIMGICGETQLNNERDSWVTMMQVYEYFISHHLAKAFESLFGSVTCLPGCFSMYRVRTATRNVPLLISPGMIEDYSLNTVNTLHLKNLLHLGEDRYLTTLMLKHFPEMKTSFTADAQCKTNCPDKWSVLQSQRRRWINSTVHNLLELMFLPDLCGFCCFSMRFVVILDLFATVVQPAVLIYIGYLVYSVVFDQNSYFPLISIIMIAAMYGFQIIIFLLRKEWAHLGWMIIYLLATPLYTFWLPIYSFWHFDDFSWGDTRRVVGENGKEKWQSKEQDEFDTSSIPVRPWAEYERELLEKVVDDASSLHSSQNGSEGSQKYVATSYGPGSVYADGSTFGVPQMGYQASYAGSAFGGSVYPAPPPSTLGYVPTAPPTAAGSVYDYAMDPRKRQSGYFIGGGPPSVAGDWNPFSSAGRHSQYPPGFSATGANFSGELPSDEELLEEIRHILSTRDLMTVTKKSVREELSQLFNIDMSSKKDYIHKCIDLILKSQT